jgi:hypothetical protein
MFYGVRRFTPLETLNPSLSLTSELIDLEGGDILGAIRVYP